MRARRILHALARRFAVLIGFRSNADRQVPFIIAGLASGAVLSLGGCADLPPQRLANANPKEYFPSSIYGPASPRVIADGEPVPRGGGIYMVGKPYTVAGHLYYPSEKHYAAVGLASWYGDAFHGRLTANGEVYDRDAISAAHPTMPLPCYARVTNLRNKYSMIVRVNDRGPFTDDRIMDVSRKTAEVLGFSQKGTTPVKVEYAGAADLAGSNDLMLLATLRSDRPAAFTSLDQHNRKPEAKNVPSIAAEPAAQPIAVAADEAESEPKSSVRHGHSAGNAVPLPPPRPFDLRTSGRARKSIALR
jgi:rare lipoprotein A